MAIYSCNLRSVGRTTHAEGTAGAHLRYIGRERAEPEIVAEHMPRNPQAARTWMNQQERADRKNARVIDKIRLALPRELDEVQRAALVREFMADLTQGRVPWYAAIHQTGRDRHNPHAHIAVRDRDTETGKRVLRLSDSAKDREKAGLEPKAVEWVRERWEHHANRSLERAGHTARIDRRTLAAQAIDRKPQIHVGPAARHVDMNVNRPVSKERLETSWGRSYRDTVPYPMIDAGRTRREANARIIDLNLERKARSPDFATRTWAQHEKEQRHRDRIVEDHLITEARRRTMEQRQVRAGFRKDAMQTRAQWKDEARFVRDQLKERFTPAFDQMKARHQWEQAELKAKQSRFASLLLSRIDITGTTRRRREAATSALTRAHAVERRELAGQYRATRDGQLEAVTARYKPILGELKRQQRHRLTIMRDRHDEQERRAEAALQGREAEREQERVALQQTLDDWHRQQRSRQAEDAMQAQYSRASGSREAAGGPQKPRERDPANRGGEDRSRTQDAPTDRQSRQQGPSDSDRAPEPERPRDRSPGRGRSRSRRPGRGFDGPE